MRMPTAALALIGFGGVCVALSLWSWKTAEQASAWPPTPGVMIQSAVQADSHDAGLTLRLRYRYTVDGRQYEASRVRFGTERNDAESLHRRAAQYPLGAQVTVFYDPSSPGRAVLEPAPADGWKWMLALGAILIALGLIKA